MPWRRETKLGDCCGGRAGGGWVAENALGKFARQLDPCTSVCDGLGRATSPASIHIRARCVSPVVTLRRRSLAAPSPLGRRSRLRSSAAWAALSGLAPVPLGRRSVATRAFLGRRSERTSRLAGSERGYKRTECIRRQRRSPELGLDGRPRSRTSGPTSTTGRPPWGRSSRRASCTSSRSGPSARTCASSRSGTSRGCAGW